MPVKYSEQKFPAAPVLEVKISQPGESPEIEALPALIDTGGDFTTVPLLDKSYSEDTFLPTV